MVSLYSVSISLSVVLLALAFVVGRSRFGIGGVCCLAIAAVLVSCLWFWPAVFLQSALMFVLALACMVGSIRAAKDCLDCHSVDRGHLLGAFTYELVPEQPRGKPPAAPSARPAAAPL